jgi:hypothetical protein
MGWRVLFENPANPRGQTWINSIKSVEMSTRRCARCVTAVFKAELPPVLVFIIWRHNLEHPVQHD